VNFLGLDEPFAGLDFQAREYLVSRWLENRYAGLQTARIIRRCTPGETKGVTFLSPLQPVLDANTHVCVLPNRAVHRYSNYQRATSGSNPARLEA